MFTSHVIILPHTRFILKVVVVVLRFLLELKPKLLVLNCHMTPCSSVDQVACSVPTSAAAAAGNKNFSFSGAPSSSGNAQFSIGEGWVVAVCSDDL